MLAKLSVQMDYMAKMPLLAGLNEGEIKNYFHGSMNK